jgi:hypothetical protein
MAPLHLVVANLQIVSSGNEYRYHESVLRCDNTGQWVVSTNTNTHNHTPKYDDSSNRNCRRSSGKSLSECGEDDNHKLEAIHSFTTDNIREDTETNLANDGTFDNVRENSNNVSKPGLIIGARISTIQLLEKLIV